MSDSPVRKAVIPAAGFGTRFLPIAKAVPKEMLPIVDRPVIERVVEEAVAAGVTDILMIVSRGKRAIEEYFNPHPELERQLIDAGKNDLLEAVQRVSGMARIHFFWQPRMQGLGDAVLCARAFCGSDPFALMLGDTILESSPGHGPVIGQLAGVHAQHGGSVVAVERVPPEKVARYGIVGGTVVSPGLHRLDQLVEKPLPEQAPSNLAIASRYLFEPAIFDHLAAATPGKGGEIQLTDAMMSLVGSGAPMHAREIRGRRHDIGQPLDFVKTNVHYALQDPDSGDALRAWLRQELESPQ